MQDQFDPQSGQDVTSGVPEISETHEMTSRESRKFQAARRNSFFGGMLVGVLSMILILAVVFVVLNRDFVLYMVRSLTGNAQTESVVEGSDGEGSDVEPGEGANAQSGEDAASSDSAEEAEAQPDTVLRQDSFAKIQALEDAIKTYYYQSDIDIKGMENGMYKGLVSGLGDPYTEYYDETEMKKQEADYEGVFYGIGCYIFTDEETGMHTISGVMKDGPADKAGIKAGDIFIKVDGEDATQWSLNDLVRHVKGDKDTVVHLTMYREGEQDYLELDVTRGEVPNETVNGFMVDDNTGYVSISSFEGTTPSQFTDCIEFLQEKGMKGMILDLRNNLGGNVEAVTDIADQILGEGVIVYTMDRDGNRHDYLSDAEHKLDIPIVLLVNGYSASASEILAGALKDYGAATLVGTQTFGKGVVQSILPFNDGTALKITISSYYTPKGNNIHKIGITPDVVLELDKKAYQEDSVDNQFEKALELVHEQIGE